VFCFDEISDIFVILICSIAYPDVIEKNISPDHEFIVLACDGIWDVLTNQEVVTFVRSRIAQGMQPDIVSYIWLDVVSVFSEVRLILSKICQNNISKC
jgi:serine/threonine protein phosphatase PrpC